MKRDNLPIIPDLQKNTYIGIDLFTKCMRIFIVSELEKCYPDWCAEFRKAIYSHPNNDKQKNFDYRLKENNNNPTPDLIDILHLEIFANNMKDFLKPIFGNERFYLPTWFNEIAKVRNPTAHSTFENLSNSTIELAWLRMMQIAVLMNDNELLSALTNIRDNKPILLRNKQERTLENFISELEIPESSRYCKLNELFVPPKEFSEIKTHLKNKRVIFISGPPEFGKTFTSIVLLWEWYKEGYSVKWIQGDSISEREKVRRLFGQSINSLNQNTIYYFEDPFGKTEYENSNGELESRIFEILGNIECTANSFVIITSREDVFDEFKIRSLSKKSLTFLEKRLNAITPSYDSDQRKIMLVKYGHFFDCKWLNDDELKSFVFKKLHEENMLPSPYSIFNFSLKSRNNLDNKLLQISFDKASADTGWQFAHEVLNMNYEEKLFFTILFTNQNRSCLDDFYINFPSRNKIVSDTLIVICHKFINKKIEQNPFSGEIKLIHPSLYLAWSYLKDNVTFKDIVSSIANNDIENFSYWLRNYNDLNDFSKKSFCFRINIPYYASQIFNEIIISYHILSDTVKEFLFISINVATKNMNVNDWHDLLSYVVKRINLFPRRVQNLIGSYGGDLSASLLIKDWKKLDDNAKNLVYEIINNERVGVITFEQIFKNSSRLPINLTKLIPKMLDRLWLNFDECVKFIELMFRYDSAKFFNIKIEDVFLKNWHIYKNRRNAYNTEYYNFIGVENLLLNNFIPEKIKKIILNFTIVYKWVDEFFKKNNWSCRYLQDNFPNEIGLFRNDTISIIKNRNNDGY